MSNPYYNASGTPATGSQGASSPVRSEFALIAAGFTLLPALLSGAAVTGTGNVVLATSPTLVTPALGTPSSITLSNATGLPVSTGISGLGTGVATALGNAVNASGGLTTNGTDLPLAGGTVTGATTFSGGLTGTLTGHASLDLPLTGGTVTGATTFSGGLNSTAIGATTASAAAFTTLSASGAVSGAGFAGLLSSPSAIGNVAPSAGGFTSLGVSGATTLAGVSFGTTFASGPTNLANHINLYHLVSVNNYGFSVTSGCLNVVANSVLAGVFSSSGLDSVVIGSQTPSAGTFTSVQTGSTLGPTWTTGNGAPSVMQPAGSLYSNALGNTGTRLYVSSGSGGWLPVAGV